jgi:ribonuclease HIII
VVNLPGCIIGVDESGKGDFFGPLVVAGLLAGGKDRGFFEELGVRDSKRITDKRILTIDERLRARLPHRVVVVMPEQYNARYDELRNLNILLAECHAGVISGLLKENAKVDLAVSDKFGKTERLETALADLKCRLPVRQMVRGEAVPQVAAASIVARAEFIRRMESLSADCGENLPKGASPQVDAAGRRLVAAHGPEILRRLAKLHFKNYRRALATDMFS